VLGERGPGPILQFPPRSVEISLDELPAEVLHALRDIRDAREMQLKKLSAGHRRLLAAAEHLIARHIDLMAQIDGNGFSDRREGES
jgi:hypothetical protein